jgi:hypothetical protein
MVETETMTQRGPALGALQAVQATFASPGEMQDAIGLLEVSGFDRADLSVPNAVTPVAGVGPDSGARPADTEQDARQARTLHTSGVAAAAALAAAGITIGTGGAAAPAVAAAVLAGTAAGGATFAASSAANNAEQAVREADAAQGVLTLMVRTATTPKREAAVAILRSAGATDIQTL